MKKTPLPKGPADAKATGGFTLVELMVAIAVLGIMMLGIIQLMNAAAAVTLIGFKHMNADTQARVALDRMAFDISRMVKRTDVDFYFPPAVTGSADPSQFNDQMSFFSESTGYYDPSLTIKPGQVGNQGSNVSLVGYRIAPSTTASGAPQLQRLSKGLAWNGVGSGTAGPFPMVYLPQTILQTWTDLAPGNNDPDYQILGDQIFRLEIDYLLQKTVPVTTGGTTALTTYTGYSSVPNLEGVAPGAIGYFNPNEVVAVIASIAVLDARSQKILQPGVLATAALNLPSVSANLVPVGAGDPKNPNATLPVAPDSTKLPRTTWENALDTALSAGTPSPLGLPKIAASQIRFYQRYCYLSHTVQ